MPQEHWNTAEAIAAQEEYCEKHGAPHFAPHSGLCFRCHLQIYGILVADGKETYGISVEKAGNQLITGCPFCHISFVD